MEEWNRDRFSAEEGLGAGNLLEGFSPRDLAGSDVCRAKGSFNSVDVWRGWGVGVLMDIMEVAGAPSQSKRAASFSLRGYRTLGTHSLWRVSGLEMVPLPLEPIHRDF